MSLKIIVHSRKGFSGSQIKRHDQICSKTEIVVNSIEFRSRVLNYHFTNNKGLTSLQIYQLIMNGAELLSPENDGEIDVMVELYEKNNSTVGYTFENTLWTWLNNKFYSKLDDASAAGNLIHEWLHKLGFDHTSATEYTSVPYAIGYIVRDLVRQMDMGMKLTPLWESDDYEFPTSLPVTQKKYVCSRSWRNFFRKVCWYE